MSAPDEIALFAGRFNAIGVEYMVTGATAAIVYGQPRLTNDLDVVLALRGEYVIVRKLEYFREGGSSKHPADIRAMLATTEVDLSAIESWVERLGLTRQWTEIRQ